MSRVLKQLSKSSTEIELESPPVHSQPELKLVSSSEEMPPEAPPPEGPFSASPAEATPSLELHQDSKLTIELNPSSSGEPPPHKIPVPPPFKKKRIFSPIQKFILALGLVISALYGFRLWNRAPTPTEQTHVSAPPSDQEPELSTVKDDEKMNRDAIVLFQSGQYKIALDRFIQLVNRHPKSSSAHTNLGLTYFRLQNFTEARKHLEVAIELNSKDVVAYNNLGIVVLKEGSAESAIRYFQKAIEINPSFADSHLNLGKTLEQTGHPNQAAQAYQVYTRLVTADPVVKKLLEKRIQKLHTLTRFYEKAPQAGGSS